MFGHCLPLPPASWRGSTVGLVPAPPPPPLPTHLHCKNTPAASCSQVGSPGREECGGFQLWHSSCAQPPGSTLLPCDFLKARCGPKTWALQGRGVGGREAPPTTVSFSLSAKILPADSCGGGSRVDVCVHWGGGAYCVYGSKCVERILSVDLCMNMGTNVLFV